LSRPEGTFLRRTTSYDVLSVKISPTAFCVGARKKRKSSKHSKVFPCIFHVCWGQKPLGGLTPYFWW